MSIDFEEYNDGSAKIYDHYERSKIAESYFIATGKTGEVKTQKIPSREIDATYFAQTFAGGNSVIVDSNGKSLFAKNGITPKAHLDAFIAGKRTTAPYFTEKKPTIKKPNPLPQQNQPQNSKNDEDSKYGYDPVTKKRYKKLGVASKEAITAHKANENSGLTLDQARKMIGIDEDFDLDDLEKSAELFMGHLRVAPDKEEIERLRRERSEKMKAQARAHAAETAGYREEEESEDRANAEEAFDTDLKFR